MANKIKVKVKNISPKSVGEIIAMCSFYQSVDMHSVGGS